MGLRKKLTVHFVLHFILMLAVIIIVITSSLVYLSFIISKSEMKSDFTRVSRDYLEHSIKVKDNKALINEEVKASVLKKGGWLQVIDQSGSVIGEYNSPIDLPDTYTFYDIVSSNLDTYKTYNWSIKDIDGSDLTILYGEKVKSREILNALKKINGFPDLSEEVKNYLKGHNGWVQIYNSGGKIISSYNAPKRVKYHFNDIIMNEKEPWNSAYDISIYELKEKNLIFLVGTDNLFYSPDSLTNSIIDSSFLNGFLIISATLVTMLIGLAIWYGKKFGIPLLHMMRWINNLSSGNLSKPLNKKGQDPLLNKMGALDKKYIIFSDVLKSLETLSLTLKRNEDMQQKIDKTREEWITGLSHDLRTPLSSIYGYSTLLTAQGYDWTRDEVRVFGENIQEKSRYMDDLIEDLNLTYRLKNSALPINKERHELVSIFQELMEPYKENSIIFHSTIPLIYLEIDLKWFTRIFNNLLTNAIKHNPSGTIINITISQTDKSTTVLMEDNGVGMSEETTSNIFNRYYRGGNTKENADGSGLGMAIAQQLVLAHNGEIEVTSTEGKGTSIKLIFNHSK
jgi:signal transduction histidine kinase